jgi:hypothetical protein
MLTILLILAAAVLVLLMVGMCVQLVRGDLLATLWWVGGGFSTLAELLAQVVGEILSGLNK